MQANTQAWLCVKEVARLHWKSGCLIQCVPKLGGVADGEVGGEAGCSWDRCVGVEHRARLHVWAVGLR